VIEQAAPAGFANHLKNTVILTRKRPSKFSLAILKMPPGWMNKIPEKICCSGYMNYYLPYIM